MKKIRWVIVLALGVSMVYAAWYFVRAELKYREVYGRLPKGWIVNQLGVVAFPAGEPEWAFPSQFMDRRDSPVVFALPVSSDEWRLYVGTNNGVEVYVWMPKSRRTRFINRIAKACLVGCGYTADISGEVVAMQDRDTADYLFVHAGTGKQYRRKFQAVYFSNKKNCFWVINRSWLGLYNVCTDHIEQKIQLPFDLSKKIHLGKQSSYVTIAPDGAYVAWIQGWIDGGLKETAIIRVFLVKTKTISDYKVSHYGDILMIGSIDRDFLILHSVIPVIGRSWVLVLDLKTGDYLVWKRFSATAFCPRFIMTVHL